MSLHDEVEAHFRAEARRIRRMAKPKPKYDEDTETEPPDSLWDEEQENKK